MNFTPEQVDLIVQRVVQQLATTAGQSAHVHPMPETSPKPGPAAEIRIATAVITHDLLADSVSRGSTVRVTSKAILTPSARDYVKHHGITIIREPAHSAAPNATRWQTLVTKSTPQIAAAVEGLSGFGISCELRLLGTPQEAAAQAISALCRGESQQVVVFTGQPELVACLANRNDKVRAAAASDTTSIERIRRDLQANLLALDPAGKSVHELKSVMSAFHSRSTV